MIPIYVLYIVYISRERQRKTRITTFKENSTVTSRVDVNLSHGSSKLFHSKHGSQAYRKNNVQTTKMRMTS